MRASRSADTVKCISDICYPVAQRFIHRIFECSRAALHRSNLGAKHLHPKNVRLLSFNINSAHIDNTLQAKTRAGGGCRNAMLSRSSFSNNPLLAHAPCEQNLTKNIIYFMRASVIKLIPLKINLRTLIHACARTNIFRDALSEIKRRGPTNIVFVQPF